MILSREEEQEMGRVVWAKMIVRRTIKEIYPDL